MIALGLGMGFAFDAYRVACGRFNVRRWMLPGLDLLYWAAATVVAFQLLLANNFGEVRLYVFLGIGIGVTGYFGLFGSFARKLVAWLYRVIGAAAKGLWKTARILLIVPVVWIVRVLARLIDIVFVVVVAILLWTAKLLLKPLGGIGGWLWKRLLPVRRKAGKWFAPVVRAKERCARLWERLRRKS